ncbi:hypothetical protein [Aerosakkonema funiforme]|uniref:hypothetical protein n=1 Tax=Aerosakkonema funiforme TaxID=1246630 RepID=UPI0035B850BC
MSHSSLRQGSQFKTLIYQEELDHIAGWVEEYPDLETGGDLFGFWTHSGFPVIQFVLGPGKTSRHNPTSFYQDREHLIKAGEILRNKHGLQHIGEWHSHHQMGLAQPSSGDEQTVFNALRQYNFPKFLLCIANLRSEAESYGRSKYTVNIGCFLFTASYRRYQTGSWVVLPNQSPIRRDVWGENRTLFSSPIPKKNWNVDKTTLEEQPLISTEPIEISDNIWYATLLGKTLLRQLSEGLTNRYTNCEMFRTPSENIYFTFEKKLNIYNADKWRLDLPNNFPEASPLIKVNHCEPTQIKDWNGKFQHLEQIEACIQSYYDGKGK